MLKFLPILLASLFGFLGTIFLGLLGANSFTKTQRKKYPFLTKLDSKQVHLLVGAIICFAVAYIFGSIKDIISIQPTISSQESTEKQVGFQNKIEYLNENKNGNNIIEQEKKLPENTNIFRKDQLQTEKKQINNKQKEILSSSKMKIDKTPKIQTQSLSNARDLISQGKYNSAIAECDRILSINPKNSEAISLKKWSQKQLEILNP